MDRYGSSDKYGLSDRKKQILKAIIESHIELGEPVGSKYLTSMGLISCSSATIRNEMAELEELGFLEQPHTSAGRIPSELGYRLYVDSLAERYRLTESEISELRRTLRIKEAELDSILDAAVKLASKLTHYTALSVKPKKRQVSVTKFEVIPVDSHGMMLIMLMGAVAKTKHIKIAHSTPPEAASRLSDVLNTCIAGLTSEEITMPIIMKMEYIMGEYDYLVAPIVRSVCEVISSFDGGELRFDGINRILSYPDYDTDRLSEMLDLFEKKDALLQVLSDGTYSDPENAGVRIYIGRENIVKIMDNSTLIYKTVRHDGSPVGAIGIIGPKRMNYRRAIALIDRLSDGVTDLIDENGEE